MYAMRAGWLEDMAGDIVACCARKIFAMRTGRVAGSWVPRAMG